MKNLPVHWFEGLFLRPHHFQASDRAWQERLQVGEQCDHPYHYGLHSLKYSREAIANSQFELSQCLARLPDGTLVSIEPGEEPDRLSLKKENGSGLQAALEEAFQKAGTVTVYLALPKLRLGRANVGPASDPGLPRYQEKPLMAADENATGNDQEISVRSQNVRILLSTNDVSGYELLPIARLRRAGGADPGPQLDDDYIPPLLRVEAWPPLATDYVRAIYDMIGKRIDVYSQWAADRGVSLSTNEPGEAEKMRMLMLLNEAYATLQILGFARGCHPFQVYVELCRIVGTLSIFRKDRRVPKIPPYDHDDLARIFKWVRQEISDLIHVIPEDVFEQRFFEGMAGGRGVQVALESRWLNEGWDWFVGVNRGTISETECRQLLAPGRLNWKLASAQEVDRVFSLKMEGLKLEAALQAPRPLPSSGGWIYYRVGRESTAWNDVVATSQLGLRFTEGLIANRDELPGNRNVVINAGGKTVTLQFALFAVRQPTAS